MSIYLGNLSVNDMQKRTGVAFPQELIEYMGHTRQEEASNVRAGQWHCFDIPFILVCGDMPTAEKIYSFLKPLSESFETPMQIGLS